MLSLRAIRRSLTGDFQIAVRTVLPFQVTSRGRPTFTESRRDMNTSKKLKLNTREGKGYDFRMRKAGARDSYQAARAGCTHRRRLIQSRKAAGGGALRLRSGQAL